MSLIDAALAALAYIETGDDADAPPVAQVERDAFHATAGVALGLTLVGGAVYLRRGLAKQAADGAARAGRRDARLDRRFIVWPTAFGMAVPLALGLLAGWVWGAALAASAAAALLAAAVVSLRARGLAS